MHNSEFKNNLDRWSKDEAISARWEERAETIAKMIPKGASILDAGCGNQILKEFLPADVSYTPADLTARTPDTLLFDANKGVWPEGHWDYIVAAGLLEYVCDLDCFFGHAGKICDQLIFTYHVNSLRNQKSLDIRSKNGWLTDYSLTDLISAADRAGFYLQSAKCPNLKKAYGQYYFLFTRKQTAAALPAFEDCFEILDSHALCPAAWRENLHEDPRVFNPSIVAAHDGESFILCYRVVGANLVRRIAICRVSTNLACIEGSVVPLSDLLAFSNHPHLKQRARTWHADPRLFWLNNRLYVTWNDGGNKPENHQFMVEIDPKTLSPVGMVREIQIKGERRSIEKNWMFFSTRGSIWAVYSVEPLVILAAHFVGEDKVICERSYTQEWKSDYSPVFGVLRGSAGPMRWRNGLLTIAHSSHKMADGRHYVACAYELSHEFPFGIRRSPVRPLALPNPLKGHCAHEKLNADIAQVIYPCGSVIVDDGVLISYGINDERCAIARMPLNDVEKTLAPVASSMGRLEVLSQPKHLLAKLDILRKTESNQNGPATSCPSPKMCLPLFWWNAAGKKFDTNHGSRMFSVGNFGDIASRDIVQQLSGLIAISPSPAVPKMLAVGSVLHRAASGDIIWGSGIKGGAKQLSPKIRNLYIAAVRGPLSLDYLKKSGQDVDQITRLFDPGYLLAHLHERYLNELPEPDPALGRIRIVPHYKDDLFMRRLYHNYLKSFVSVDCSPLEMLRSLKGAEAVFSSSLHGIIFAESLGIPAYWLKPLCGEDTLKYYDYYYGTDRYEVRMFEDLHAALKAPPMPLPTVNHAACIATFPLKALFRIATPKFNPHPKPLQTKGVRAYIENFSNWLFRPKK